MLGLGSRNVRSAVLASGLLVLAACGNSSSSHGAADSAHAAGQGGLNVYNWSDYVAPDTVANFQAASGIHVNYEVYSSNTVLDQKLTDKVGDYDVVFPSARPYAQNQIAHGLLAKLDKSKLPNLKNLDPETLQALQSVDPGNAYLVPYLWGTTGLGVNVTQVKAALGEGADLDSWTLLFDPEKARKLSACGIGVLDDDLEGHGAALIAKGRSPNDQTDADMSVVRDAYAAIRPHIRKFGHSNELIDDLASGALCLVLTYSGDVSQAIAKAEEANPDGHDEIRYVIPREGALRWMDVVAIPANAPHADAAHAFINYLLEPKVIADITNVVAYANANAAATALIDKSISSDPGIYPPPHVAAKLSDSEATTAEQVEKRKTNWHRIVYALMF